jgi:hypothetical protein
MPQTTVFINDAAKLSGIVYADYADYPFQPLKLTKSSSASHMTNCIILNDTIKMIHFELNCFRIQAATRSTSVRMYSGIFNLLTSKAAFM